MNFRLTTLWAGLLLPLALHAQPTGTPSQPLSLQQVLQAAQDNLDVALSRRNLASAQADIASADRAPLPMLSAGVSQIDLKNGNGSGRVLQDRTYDKTLGLDWTWERGNKRELRTLTALRAADAARAELDDTVLQQRVAALTAFYELLAAQERLEANAQLDGNAAELARTAARRLQAGDLSAQETARTEIEAQRARAERRQAELELQRSALALWQLTALASPPQLQARADWPVSTQGIANVDFDALVEERADVRAARARVEAAQAALDASAALKKSDITWGVSYNHYPGTSTALMALRMQMPLQWGYAYQGEIGRASAQFGQAQDALERTRRQARQEFERLQHEVLSTAERTAVFDGEILPRARRVAEGAELAYRKGALSLTDLLDARRTLRVTALDAVAARKEHAQILGTWQLRTGQGVTAATP
jgi:cobalt-zinc-cadmium efflux system outer membrane protein